MRSKIVAIIALLIGPFILFMNFKETSEKTKVDKEGIEIPALVIDKIEKKGRKGRVDRDFEVGYIVDDGKRPLAKKVEVSKELFEKTPINAPIKVKYLKADPNQMIIVGEPLSNNLLYAVGSAVLLFGVGSVWWNFMRKPTA
jgi:hypothetical protein